MWCTAEAWRPRRVSEPRCQRRIKPKYYINKKANKERIWESNEETQVKIKRSQRKCNQEEPAATSLVEKYWKYWINFHKMIDIKQLKLNVCSLFCFFQVISVKKHPIWLHLMIHFCYFKTLIAFDWLIDWEHLVWSIRTHHVYEMIIWFKCKT